MPRFNKWLFRMFITQATIFLSGAVLIMIILALGWDGPKSELIVRLSLVSCAAIGTVAIMARMLFKFEKELREEREKKAVV